MENAEWGKGRGMGKGHPTVDHDRHPPPHYDEQPSRANHGKRKQEDVKGGRFHPRSNAAPDAGWGNGATERTGNEGPKNEERRKLELETEVMTTR